jgi:hypothetical protein
VQEGCAADVGAACADLVGPPVVSVILHGSLAFEHFAPGRSDIAPSVPYPCRGLPSVADRPI